MEMTVHVQRNQEESREIRCTDRTVAVYQKENQSVVPDQYFSFEHTWSTAPSRKQVACLILKVAFPELDPRRAYFGDQRVCTIVNVCRKAENDAFEISSCHSDYECRVKEIISSLLQQKHSNVDMTRALERLRRSRALTMVNRHNNERERQLALPAPHRRSSVSDDSHASITSELSPIPYHGHEEMEIEWSVESLRQPLATSTPVSRLSRKRHFDPEDNQAKVNAKTSRLMNKINGVVDETSLSKSPKCIVPPHLIKQEIKTERPSPPSSPMQCVSVKSNHNSSQVLTSACGEPTTHPIRRRAHSTQSRKSKILRSMFTPIFNKIMSLNDSKQFKFRNERDRYLVTCYYKENEPVTRPFDLLGVQSLMNDDNYMSNPWNFITDMCWVFILPTCTPRKNLKKQKCAKNLLKNFMEQTNKIMVDFKYCCGRQYFYFPYDLVCVGRELDVCCVPPYTKYYLFDNTWAVCEKCWNLNKNSTVKIRDRRTNEEKFIQKSEFEEFRNDKVYIEPMVTCVNCRRDYHKICVKFLELNGCNVYTCDLCLAARGLSREIKLKSSLLPSCVLDRCIQSRINKYLLKQGLDLKVWVRVVSNVEKTTEIKRGMKELYVDGGNEYKLSESYPYRQKVIFAFEEIDGNEVAFFAMYVQEYGSECPPPNTRRVYISYLDSVHYFQPKQYRTAVYHEILLAYLEHTKSLGFTTFHIWACPPNEGNDYIFYAHPPEQKVPKAVRLLDWYKRMLEKGLVEGIVIEYKDMCRQVIDDNLQSVVQIPYLDGDFWPECFETTIKSMEDEKNQLAVVKRNASKKKKSRAKKPAELLLEKQCENILKSDALSSRIMSLVQVHKDLFFVAYLNSPSGSTQPIIDPDPVTPTCIADSRDALLENSRENMFEFSTLRRAIYSTQMLLKECTPGFGDRVTYTCNNCGKGIDEKVMSYTCSKCVDFDLCDFCLRKHAHPHKMRPRGVDIQSEIPEVNREVKRDELLHEEGDTTAVRCFAHAAQCRDVDCSQLHCHKLKTLFYHSKQCRGASWGCNHCQQLGSLVSQHASVCTIPMLDCQILKCPQSKVLARLSVAEPASVIEFRECNPDLANDSEFSKVTRHTKLI